MGAVYPLNFETPVTKYVIVLIVLLTMYALKDFFSLCFIGTELILQDIVFHISIKTEPIFL